METTPSPLWIKQIVIGPRKVKRDEGFLSLRRVGRVGEGDLGGSIGRDSLGNGPANNNRTKTPPPHGKPSSTEQGPPPKSQLRRVLHEPKTEGQSKISSGRSR